MTKEEIYKTIFDIQTDEQIIDFVKTRIQELEDASTESWVGQNYTTTFREYISEKMHYKAAARLKDAECPDLIYDDLTPYINLIKAIRQNSWYNELTLFTTIFFEVYSYLPSLDYGFTRAYLYITNKGKRISITQIRDNACAFCAEKSGMAHNMFKFLGIDSELVCGLRNSERHAYNIIYPFGYGNEPMVIYDPSFFVTFIKDGQRISRGYFSAMRKEQYEKLMSGLPVKLDFSRTEKNYRQLYSLGGEYVFEGDTAFYVAGLD